MSDEPKPKDDELSAEQVRECLDDGAYVFKTLAAILRDRGIEACTTELHRFVDEHRAKWALLATVVALVNADEKIERLEFDKRHFGNGGPKLH
jgi:hypothetical protein